MAAEGAAAAGSWAGWAAWGLDRSSGGTAPGSRPLQIFSLGRAWVAKRNPNTGSWLTAGSAADVQTWLCQNTLDKLLTRSS